VNKLIGTLAALALATSGLTFVTAAPAMAASGCATTNTVTSSSATGTGGSSVTITDTVKDCNGAAVAGATVTFSQTSGPCSGTFSSTTATTNAAGQASVTFTLPANCPGQYVVNAAAGGTNGSTTVVESGGFPATSAAVPTSTLPVGAVALLGAGLLMVVAGALTLLQRRS
jgi:hypothetical protein